MSTHVIVIEHIHGGRKDVVSSRPEPRGHGYFLSHEYVRQERIERHLVQKGRRSKEEAGSHKRSIFRHFWNLVIKCKRISFMNKYSSYASSFHWESSTSEYMYRAG